MRSPHKRNNGITTQLLPNNADIVEFSHAGRENGEEEGEDFSLLKGQIKAITLVFVIVRRN